ncbi:MAG: hypothetical protein ACLSAF_12035 [Intestinimonas sp.]
MGDCGAYLACTADALGGKVTMDMGLPSGAPASGRRRSVLGGITVVPPCWIGPGASIEEGSLLGPHAVVGPGAFVGRRSLVQRSVLMENAKVAERCTLYGTILCRGAAAQAGAVLNEGTVLGAEGMAGENSVLMERVKVWPGRKVPKGARLTASLVSGGGTGRACFGDGGVIRGTLEEELSPELLMTLGGALGAEGRLGLGYGGGECARMLAPLRRDAARRRRARRYSSTTADVPRWGPGWRSGTLFPPPFVEQEGGEDLSPLFRPAGAASLRARQRKLRAPFSGRGPPCVRRRSGAWEHVTGHCPPAPPTRLAEPGMPGPP